MCITRRWRLESKSVSNRALPISGYFTEYKSNAGNAVAWIGASEDGSGILTLSPNLSDDKRYFYFGSFKNSERPLFQMYSSDGSVAVEIGVDQTSKGYISVNGKYVQLNP
jgi:hypothetical protein